MKTTSSEKHVLIRSHFCCVVSFNFSSFSPLDFMLLSLLHCFSLLEVNVPQLSFKTEAAVACWKKSKDTQTSPPHTALTTFTVAH